MSDCCHVTGLHFGEELVSRELRTLNHDGPGVTTSKLIELIEDIGVKEASVLDVGGGLGAASEALLTAGADRATVVEASEAYVRAARSREWKPGLAQRVDFQVGDFVAMAASVDAADVVVLDRVICCDPRLEAMVEAAAEKTGRILAASYPRDRIPVRVVIALQNLVRRMRSDDFQVHVHPVDTVRDLMAQQGLALREVRRTFVWELAIYERRAPGPTVHRS